MPEEAGESPVGAPTRYASRRAVAAGLAALVALTAWLGWRDLETRRVDRVRAEMVQAGRDGLVALTTVDHRQVDADVQRILDLSTGGFRDDFASRAEPFKQAARAAQSTSVGTVTAAGVESAEGDQGLVLVALTVMTSNRGEPERRPKSWRTRVTVVRDGERFKVAAVEFVA